ncbi:RICIN domain-containing protein [Streptomyces sp. NPDC057702]|uniref:RICIN domain-containing protein n=1 Tax=unclassified Streptomyces TaxID=2593676 RepID=UPI0036D1FD3B
MRVHIRSSRWLSVAAATAAVIAGSVPSVGHASQGFAPPSGPTRIKTFGGDPDVGQCIAIKGINSDRENGARAVQRPCGPDANQRFTFVSVGGGRYEIRTFADNKCLDVANRSDQNKAQIIQFTCHRPGQDNQRFRVVDGPGNTVYLRTFAPGKCLDVQGADPNVGAPLIQYQCQQSTNQRFRFG